MLGTDSLVDMRWFFVERETVASMAGERDLTRAWKRPGTAHAPGEDDGGLPFDDLNFHRYCAVYPFRPDDDPELHDADAADIEIRLIRGLPRWGLRNTPLVILAITLLFFGGAELWPGVEGISTLLPTLSLADLSVLAVVLGTVPVTLALLVQIDLLDVKTLYTAGIVYGLAMVLTAGTVVSAALVALVPAQSLGPNVIFTSGYLLVMLFGGMLVYDSVLRTEYLLKRLPETRVVADATRYGDRLEALSARLDRTLLALDGRVLGRRVHIPTSHVISALGVSVAVYVWTRAQGPQNLGFPITTLGNAALDFVIGIVIVQFLIVVRWLYDLVNDDVADVEQSNVLTYEAYHPDGHGGYRDLGKFVTRVNVLFIISGLYAVYRLYVHGLRAAPAEVASTVDPTVATVLWVLNFGGPVVLYPFIIAIWLYYSVWQIHLRMIRERERTYATMTDRFDTETDWHVRTEGSVWPFDNTQLHSLLYGHLWPVVLTFLPLVVSRFLLG